MIKKSLKILGIIFLITLGVLLALREIYFVGPVKTPITSLPPNIIDLHSHVAGIGSGSSNFISDELKNAFKFKLYLAAFNTSLEEIQKEGDQIVAYHLAKQVKESKYVTKSVILALDGAVDSDGNLDATKTQIYVSNDFVAKQAAKYETLLYGASINPYRDNAIQLLRQAKLQGAVLVKWIPNIQLIDLDCSDEKLSDALCHKITRFYDEMVKLDLPLLTHTGQEKAFSHANDEYGDPKRLIKPLKAGVTVIAAHIGTTGENDSESNYSRLLPMLKQYDNLYTELSSLTQANKLGYLNDALQQESITDKIMYGSDYPLSNTILVTPFNFPLNLTLKQMFTIAMIENHWDRDVKLKQALGVSSKMFSQASSVVFNE